MKLSHLAARAGWRDEMESIGFAYHSFDGGYWMDELALELSQAEWDECGHAAADIHALGLDLVAEACRKGDFEPWRLPLQARELISQSWSRCDPSLYGRFDFTFGADGRARAYEYNADTPTSIMEGGRAQGAWARARGLRDACLLSTLMPRAFARLGDLGCSKIAIAGLSGSVEDTSNLFPMVDWAREAGIDASLRPVEDMELYPALRRHGFEGEAFDWVFKLFPWEQLATGEPGSEHLSLSDTRFVEPAWKLLLSSKAFMAEAWRAHPGHPNLLPCYHAGSEGPGLEAGWVKKPLLSREGANVEIFRPDGSSAQLERGPYGKEGFVVQAFCPMPEPEPQKRFTVGGWIAAGEFAGCCARFTDDLIVTNVSWACGCCVGD